jgi:hypothetical protein
MLILVESKLDFILEPKELIYQMNVVPEKKLCVCLLKQMNVALDRRTYCSPKAQVLS